MRFLGAKVVLTNPAHKFGGMVQTLRALQRLHLRRGLQLRLVLGLGAARLERRGGT